MDLLYSVTKNKFSLILVQEEQYLTELNNLLRLVEKRHNNIGYICFNKCYKDFIEDIVEKGMDTNRFFFVDILSSHYTKQKPTKNCIFIEEPINIGGIKSAIVNLIDKKGCSIIIVDPISELLMFESKFSIIQFTHTLTMENKDKNKVFIIIRENEFINEDVNGLTKDLSMLADKILDLSISQK